MSTHPKAMPGCSSSDATVKIGAVVLAAGRSTRMGQPKMVLPWGRTTVIGNVISTLDAAGVEPVIVVIGSSAEMVREALLGTRSEIVFNPDYETDNMLISLRWGLSQMPGDVHAALVVLGDQPQIQEQVVQQILAEYRDTPKKIIIPSFQMRRGHPWLIDRSLWSELSSLPEQVTLQAWLKLQSDNIHHTDVENDSILRDLDTPEDYLQEHPEVNRS